MKFLPPFLLVLLAGCQQFPQLPAGVVGVNLTYTIAPTEKEEAPKEVVAPREPEQLVK
mgnify:FL=1